MSDALKEFMTRGLNAQKAVDAIVKHDGIVERVTSVGFVPLAHDERKILAIDPGPVQSAYVGMYGERVMLHGKVPNDILLARLDGSGAPFLFAFYDQLVLEMIFMGGMPAGREVFETCVWIGRFLQCAVERGIAVERVERHAVKTHLCNNQRAKDSNIRQAIIDRYGPGKDVAIGRKAKPGPLYGMTVDRWQALAVGLTWLDAQK